ncbi:DUF6986 family protein [Lapillicoccus sp.]|uniref:DUF6986 family protein n=1 Tax=Lapillicoccus sp. TaxID=1909287 RepID=UPI0039839EF1
MSRTDDLAARLDAQLAQTDADLVAHYPGEDGSRQPVHTVYVPADRFGATLVPEWGARALEEFTTHLADPDTLARILDVAPALAAEVAPLVAAKLAAEPIEDLRIDFEDGYGSRDDAVEDAEVDVAVASWRASRDGGRATAFSGIRFKSFEAPTRRRGLETLSRFVGGAVTEARLPDGFVVTLPKVTAVAQVEAMVDACTHLEDEHQLAPGALRFEIQVETPQAVLLADGTAGVARMIAAAGGRCTGLHYGTYDYSASLGISAAQQSMDHPVADHAKAVMQVAAAGTGVRLSDGSTNILPVGDIEARYAAWRLHARLVRRSLDRGFYQGWDLHPAQLPTRHAATFAFYRQGFGAAATRLRAYVSRTGSGFLDEPATARALAWFILRGLHCGAITDAECREQADLDRSAIERLAHPGRGEHHPR